MADNVENRIGFDATDAIRTLVQLEEQVKKYTTALAANPKAATAFNKSNAFERGLKAQNAQLKSAVTQLRAYVRAQTTTGASAQQAAAAQRAAATALAGVASGAGKSTQQLGGLEGQLGSTLQAFVRYRIVSGIFIAIEREIRAAVDTARELELRLAEIQTISPEFRIRGLESVQGTVQDISGEFGIDQIEVASALYQTLSNQIGNAAQSQQFLADAARFSRATLTDLSSSVDLLAGILNAYSLEASNAGRVSDVLFKTIELGRVRGEELAANFGNITTQAAQLGISVEEIGASLATITIQGVKADTAMTGLQNIFNKLIRPSEAMKRALDEIGVSSIRTGIETFGLVGLLVELEKTTNGTIEEVGELFPRIRALRGEMALVADEGEKAVATQQQFEASIRGVSGAASELVLETQAAQLERTAETIRNAFTSDIGRPLIKTINDVVDSLGGAENAARLVTGTLRGIGPIAAIGIGGVAVNQVVLLTKALTAGTVTARAFSAALAFTGVGAPVAILSGLALIGIAIARNRDLAQELRDELSDLGDETQERISDINRSLEPQINTEKEAITANSRAILQSLSERQQAFQRYRDAAVDFQEQITDSLKDELNERLQLVNRLVDAVVKAQDNAAREIDSLSQGQIDFEFEINQGRFERNLQQIENPAQRAQELVRRSAELIEAARRAEGVGNVDFSQRLIEQAAQQAERAASIAGSRRVGEAQINRVLKARRDLNNRLIAQEQEKAAAAAAQEQAIRDQAVTLRRDISEFNRKQAELTKGAGTFTPEEVAQRRRESEQLEASIQGQLENISQSGLDLLLGQSRALELLGAGFRNPITGEPAELNVVVGDSVERLVAELRRAVDETPIPVRFAVESVTGLDLDIRGFEQINDQLAQIANNARTAQDNLREFTAAEQQLNQSNQAVDLSLEKLVESFARIRPERTLGFNEGLFEPGAVSRRREELESIGTALQQLGQDLDSAITANDAEAIDAVTDRLEAFIKIGKESDGLFDFDFDEQIEIAQELLGQIETLQTASQNFQQQAAGRAAGGNLSTGLDFLRRVLEDPTQLDAANQAFSGTTLTIQDLQSVGAEAGATLSAAATSAEQSQQGLQTQIEATTQALRTQLSVSQQAANAQTQGQASGGPIRYFNDGGFSPRGTDTVPAMLTPGEFVVNAASSRRFFSELVSINAGKPPVFREEGGPVNNNFTGDINLNVSAPNGVVNGREAAQQIRRELRRRTSKL